jgi:hypothetical protein
MKRILFAIFAGIALAGCDQNKDTTTTKDARDAVDATAKDAKKQIDATADAAKAAATNATTSATNKP